ncbi:hypothetical protein [Rurimicrobium arvi]|uniref:Uncharacterized protein n=1 Tax=Rurimicrobium arvi TaxID=2049916 RepID=A0ABP8MPM9_9BACT
MTALGALVFSFLNYIRQKRFDNENYLFQKKLEVYTSLLNNLQKVLRASEDGYVLSEKILKENHTSQLSLEQLDKQADEIDNICFAFNDLVIAQSLVISENVLQLLKRFFDEAIRTPNLDYQTPPTNILLRNYAVAY